MGFFDDDPFEDIMREFFGSSPVVRRREEFIRGEDEDRIIDFIEDGDNVYLVFELPGYNEKDIEVTVAGRELEVSAKKENNEKMQDYLSQKLRKGVVIKKKLPNFVNPRGFSYTVKNGVLEVIFKKLAGGKGNEPRKVQVR